MQRDAPPLPLPAERIDSGRRCLSGAGLDAHEWVRRFRDMVGAQRRRGSHTCDVPYPVRAIGRWASPSPSRSSSSPYPSRPPSSFSFASPAPAAALAADQRPRRWRVTLATDEDSGEEGFATTECPAPAGEPGYDAVVRILKEVAASMSFDVRAIFYHDEDFAASVLLTPNTLRYSKGRFRLSVVPAQRSAEGAAAPIKVPGLVRNGLDGSQGPVIRFPPRRCAPQKKNGNSAMWKPVGWRSLVPTHIVGVVRPIVWNSASASHSLGSGDIEIPPQLSSEFTTHPSSVMEQIRDEITENVDRHQKKIEEQTTEFTSESHAPKEASEAQCLFSSPSDVIYTAVNENPSLQYQEDSDEQHSVKATVGVINSQPILRTDSNSIIALENVCLHDVSHVEPPELFALV